MGALQQRTSPRQQNGSAMSPFEGGGMTFDSPSEYETLSGILRVLRRRWKTVALVSLGIFALGALVCMLITPKYSSVVVIEIDKEDRTQSSSADAGGSASPTADELKTEIATDISVLQSDGLALSVIRDLGLMRVKPYNSAVVPSEKDKPLDQAPRTRERLIAKFEKNLTVESPLDTRLINVTFINPDAVVAANVANALSQKFIEGAMDRRHKSTVQSSYWLRRELDDLKKQVEDSEQKLADYQRKTGMAGLQLPSGGSGAGAGGGAPHSTVTDRLFGLNQELTTAESNRIAAETIYHLVHSQDPEVVLGLGSMAVAGSGGGGASISSDGGISLVRSLRAQEAALQQEYAGAAVKYGTNNPRLTTLQQQLDAVRTQMHEELGRISKRAENSYLYAKRNEDSIRQEFVKQQSAANVMADDTVHLQVLAQEAYSNRSLYESLFSKLQNASLASGVRATRVDVVDEARPAGTPSVPNYLKFFAAIIGAGLFFGVSSAFVQEAIDETISRPRDLQEVPNVRVLGYVPSMRTKGLSAGSSGNSKLIETPKAPFSEAFRGLRTAILRANVSTGPKIFLVTSASGRDGKTTVVYNLGVAFAQQGARVLLVDCDLRNPDLHRLFGAASTPGVSDLRAPVTPETIQGEVQHATLKNLFFLPAGHPATFPAEFFESEAFDSLLRFCGANYDVVLIDSPPLLSVTDTAIIASKVTGTIAVVRSRVTKRPVLTSLVEALYHTNSPIVGMVLNDVENPSVDGFHSYSYYRNEGKQVYGSI